MKRQKRDASVARMFGELAVSSWETIIWRGMMMASGTCSPAEYQRMFEEKWTAMAQSSLAGMAAMALAMPDGNHAAAVLAPWHRKAGANARRLRRG